MPAVTEALLKKLTGAYDLELVQRLDLSARGLRSLAGVEACPNLTELDVSGNGAALDDLRPVAALAQLRRLDAGGNAVRELADALAPLAELTHLRLEGNAIDSMDELRVMSQLPKLKNLYLQNKPSSSAAAAAASSAAAAAKVDSKTDDNNGGAGDRRANPVCAHPAYTTTLLRYVPDLVVLDGERIKLRDSTQKAMLDAMAVPAAKLEIPDKQRWLDGFSWEATEAERAAAAAGGGASGGAARAPRKGVAGVHERRRLERERKAAAKASKGGGDAAVAAALAGPAPDLFDEAFVDKATAGPAAAFEGQAAEAAALDAEAEQLLQQAKAASSS